MSTTNITPIESSDQRKLVVYLEELKDKGKILHFSSIPSGVFIKSGGGKGRSQGWATLNRLKAEGLRSGAPDLVIVSPKNVLFCELKREKGSTTSEAQLGWNKAINDTGKAKAAICKGLDDAKDWIDKNI